MTGWFGFIDARTLTLEVWCRRLLHVMHSVILVGVVGGAPSESVLPGAIGKHGRSLEAGPEKATTGRETEAPSELAHVCNSHLHFTVICVRVCPTSITRIAAPVRRWHDLPNKKHSSSKAPCKQ